MFKARNTRLCPYRDRDIDIQRWVHDAGQSLDFAKSRATLICKSIPCLYAIEIK